MYFHPNELDPDWSGGTEYRDVQVLRTDVAPEDVFRELATIGGSKGWYSGGVLWTIRGLLDQLVGGPGLRRGRKSELRVGDALDFWRIEEISAPNVLRLRAEMRLPGTAWLTWRITVEDATTTITQTASYRPRGLLGRLYWASVYPFHGFIFAKMLAGIVDSAQSARHLR